MKPHATATWRGSARAGEGTIHTLSGVFNNSIFTQGTSPMGVACTNPAEILAAAEASCISMMIAKELDKEGIVPDEIEVTSEILLSREDEGWNIPHIKLTVKAFIPEIERRKFEAVVKSAKEHCPITRSLKSHVTIEALVETAVHA